MKTFKTMVKSLMSGLLCLLMVAPVLTSCYDDSGIWDKLTNLEERLNQLEVDLTAQAEAMSELLSDGSTITSCKRNDDGSYTITLSNGTKFSVLPEGTDFSTLVTYMVVDGKQVWATYDAAGKPVALTDASGKNIPVSNDISVKIKDGIYYLVINGKEYATGYDAEEVVQVFSSCTPLKDASGNVYAVKFTFGEGMEVTVALDGYKGVIFKLSSISNAVISEYYVDYGQTQSFLMEMQGVVDYVMQVPDGWRVKEVVEELTGETYLHVTAPSAETVALGAAVAEGDLKVVSVVAGGKASVSKIFVSTDPFKVYNVSPLKAVIEPYTGVQKYAYGLMLTEEFEGSSVVAKVNELLASSTDYPKGYNISEVPLDSPLAEIYGEELLENVSYVFWVVPVLYRDEDDDVEAGFFAVEDMLRTLVLNPMSVTMKVSDVTLLDADLTISANGLSAAYVGVSVKSETVLEEIVYQINNGIVDPVEGPVKYEGKVSAYPSETQSVYINPDTEYVVWLVPSEEGKTSYMVSDIVYEEFKTKSIVAGGTQDVTVGDFTVTPSSISADLTSEGAAMIYYAFLSKEDGNMYSTASNETKMSKLMESASFTEVRGVSANAKITALQPKSTKWLYAVAIADDGLYGDVVCKSAVTEDVTFNSLSLSVEEVLVKSDEATLKVTVDGGTATDFIYWVGYEKDPFWAGKETCDKSRTTAQKYMAANPEIDQIAAVMRRNGKIAEDGTITVKELSMSTDYIFLVLAKDESGNYSKAGYLKFTTLAADLGELVLSDTEKWNTTKKWIEDNITWHEDSFVAGKGSGQGYASYAFGIKIPTDLTAYISLFGTEATQLTDIIVEVEAYASRATSVGMVVYDENGQQPLHPDWYDDNGKLIQGSLVNIYAMYPHGAPHLGGVTYFSSKGHVDCTADDGGKCSNYEKFKENIAKYCSLDYWREYIIDFGNYAYQGDPTHEYSRSLTDPEKIETIAKQYYDIYYKYYHDAEPIVYVNDGSALEVVQREAMGLDDQGNVVDRVIVVLKDDLGNYYEPMYINVPNYYK